MALTSDQYQQINRLFEERQLLADTLKSNRFKEVCSKIPQYKALNDALVSLSIESTKKALLGDKSLLEGLKEKIDSLALQKQQLLVDCGFPVDYLENVYSCPVCKDTGIIGSTHCSCYKLELISLLFDQSNMSSILDNADFDKVESRFYQGEDLVHFNDSLEKSKNFVKKFDTEFDNLIFYGTVGTGKSLLSQCIAKSLLDTSHSVIYYSASSLMDVISKDTFDFNSNNENISLLYESDLLIIDDLGTEMNNNFTISAFFTLLTERILRKKSIIISTNLPYEDIRNRYTDRIFSRITGYFTFCRMSGPDIRILNKLS